MSGAEDYSTDWRYTYLSSSAGRQTAKKDISIVGVIADLLFISGLIFLGYEIFFWVRHGEWLGYPCTIMLDAVPRGLLAALENYPTLQSIVIGGLTRLDFSVVLVVSGYLLGRKFGDLL
ncbi:MAG TPA: hypothetical protein PLR20_09245 [Syntrophales bacterium]|jgi:hypothetical protein|nr:hypothetical protein [Syntrophales bacterium]HOX94187.1 hypothetical protein [Syntrophales bacterium]HPI57497.1 hypothetical protein [Syntrophales bacterium]HPN25646.1 hypothetical protein [Syntrophales bacterium]HQM29522.1 hypothetical protein [Syntrophales bacterium]